MAFSHHSNNEFKIDNPPTDCIQRVRFSPKDSTKLLTASWDSAVRLYNVASNQMQIKYHHDGPVLGIAFEGDTKCWSGGCDAQVKVYDFESQNDCTIGTHTMPVKCVEHVPEVGLVATAGWDKVLKLWDPRLAGMGQKCNIGTHNLVDKAYTMAVCGEKVLIGTAGRQVVIWDLRNMSHTVRESLLKFQIRCIEAFPNKRGYVVSSIEGRVAVEYMDMAPEIQKQKYAFKCHRLKDSATSMDLIYPVNALSFHQKYQTFATGGSDGMISIWDGQNKKRLVQFHRYPNSISSLSFSHDGSQLAIACSSLHVDDENINAVKPSDSIYIRRINEFEAKSKPD